MEKNKTFILFFIFITFSKIVFSQNNNLETNKEQNPGDNKDIKSKENIENNKNIDPNIINSEEKVDIKEITDTLNQKEEVNGNIKINKEIINENSKKGNTKNDIKDGNKNIEETPDKNKEKDSINKKEPDKKNNDRKKNNGKKHQEKKGENTNDNIKVNEDKDINKKEKKENKKEEENKVINAQKIELDLEKKKEEEILLKKDTNNTIGENFKNENVKVVQNIPIDNQINNSESTEKTNKESQNHINIEEDFNLKNSETKKGKLVDQAKILFENYMLAFHQDLLMFIPFPYDYLFMFVLGYYFMKFLTRGGNSIILKKKKNMRNTNTTLIEKKYKEITFLQKKLKEAKENEKDNKTQEIKTIGGIDLQLKEFIDNKKLDEIENKLNVLMNDLINRNKEKSTEKVLHNSICDLQMNILKKTGFEDDSEDEEGEEEESKE